MHTRSSDRFVHEPLISVVTVCLNAAKFIRHCISSVVEQEFKDFEYIIIDGGSTDGTVRIIEQYQDKLAYWQSEPDQGLYQAFNQGVRHSRGRWLLFLNSDDYFFGHHVLSRLSSVLQEHSDADVVFGQVFIVTRGEKPKVISGPHGQKFKWRRFLVRDVIPHPAALTNRHYFRRVGIFNENFRIAADYEHFLRAGVSLRADFVPVQVACMRDGGLSKKDVKASLLEARRAQTITRALPRWRATLQYYWLLCRYRLKELFVGCRAWVKPQGKHGFG